ncbi:MAG TPA: condensation domain-containing protein, partial [Thermoanaerobaculia bacterium]|nr:condensation domain-containing protein [Thermoanaerobaculia bacterium]
MNDIGQAVAALDPKKRELLALLLKRQGGEAARTILPVPRGAGPYPASFAQERLWFLDRLRPGDPAYHLPWLRTFHEGAVPETVLRQALARLCERHEALRTRFVERDGRPFQDILPPDRIAVPFAVIDLSGLAVPAEALEEEWFRLSDQEHLTPFDLGRAPLLRARLVRFPGGTETLVLTLHHIVSDGWSLGVLGRDLAALTSGKDQQTQGSLPSLPIEYVDFTVWQQEQLRGEALERHLGYWRERLAGLPPALDLPADRPRPATGSALGTRVFFVLPAALPAGVAALGRRAGATLFMTLLAGFAALLVRWSGEEDLAIGTPVAGRHHRELEPLVGLFVNSLVLRCDAAGDPSFEELLERVRRTAVEAFSHQDLPFEKLVQELRPERALNRQPLFQVMFAMRNAAGGEAAENAAL